MVSATAKDEAPPYPPVIAFRGEHDPVVSLDALKDSTRFTESLQVVTVPHCGFFPSLRRLSFSPACSCTTWENPA
ncbi:MAG: hypothetical protein U1U88_001736 [Lawsonella clevelandensis]